MSRPLSQDERHVALQLAFELGRQAESIAATHSQLHADLDRYASAAASLQSLVPSANPHLLVRRIHTIRKCLNRADFGPLSIKARETLNHIEHLETEENPTTP